MSRIAPHALAANTGEAGAGSMSNTLDIDVSDQVLICGGGIGGLALGVALAKVCGWVHSINTKACAFLTL